MVDLKAGCWVLGMQVLKVQCEVGHMQVEIFLNEGL